MPRPIEQHQADLALIAQDIATETITKADIRRLHRLIDLPKEAFHRKVANGLGLNFLGLVFWESARIKDAVFLERFLTSHKKHFLNRHFLSMPNDYCPTNSSLWMLCYAVLLCQSASLTDALTEVLKQLAMAEIDDNKLADSVQLAHSNNRTLQMASGRTVWQLLVEISLTRMHQQSFKPVEALPITVALQRFKILPMDGYLSGQQLDLFFLTCAQFLDVFPQSRLQPISILLQKQRELSLENIEFIAAQLNQLLSRQSEDDSLAVFEHSKKTTSPFIRPCLQLARQRLRLAVELKSEPDKKISDWQKRIKSIVDDLEEMGYDRTYRTWHDTNNSSRRNEWSDTSDSVLNSYHATRATNDAEVQAGRAWVSADSSLNNVCRRMHATTITH